MSARTWKDRIKAAGEKGKFSAADKKKAAAWGTCVVGEKYQGFIERLPESERKKETGGLRLQPEHLELGLKFAEAVKADKVGKARDLFKKLDEIVISTMPAFSPYADYPNIGGPMKGFVPKEPS